jgi:hypothetical protein
MDLSDFVCFTRVIEYSFCGCGFTGINVGHDADVPHFFKWYGTSHKKIPFVVRVRRPPFAPLLTANEL